MSRHDIALHHHKSFIGLFVKAGLKLLSMSNFMSTKFKLALQNYGLTG